MIAFLLNRVLHAALVLFVISVLAFVLGDVIGDPVTSILGLEATAADRAALRLRLHLDDPVLTRYAYYVGRFLQGDLGSSYGFQRPIVDLLAERIPATMELAFAALALSLCVGVPLGVLAAAHRRSRIMGALMSFSVIGVSLPLLPRRHPADRRVLPLARLAALLRARRDGEVRLLDDGLPHRLRSQVAGHAGAEPRHRPDRAGGPAVAGRDAGRAPDRLHPLRRARGLSDRAVNFSHALRNTLIPIITVSGIQLGYLVAFAIVVEQVFQWPGMGLLFLQALAQTDLPLISAFLLVAGLFFVTINLVVDLLYAAADPRLRIKTLAGRG
jgi:peptide/nickel transport system permease protein